MLQDAAMTITLSPDANTLANKALSCWNLPADAHASLMNSAENLTFLVTAAKGWKSVLRLHRDGYHTRSDIESELAWTRALRHSDTVDTPRPLAGRDGADVQTLDGRNFVMFEYVEGSEPSPDDDLSASFNRLGRLTARTHLQSLSWQRPAGFTRMSWDLDAVFGPRPIWANWREGPNINAAEHKVLTRAEAEVIQRLNSYGQTIDRYGLIHADMRLANLLVDGETTWLIDFDDCGFGWFLSDFAAAISFIETDPQIPALKSAWLDGYQQVRALSTDDLAQVDTFIMLRRLALLGWIGSRIEATEPQALAPHFAHGTAELAESWLSA